MIRSNVIGYVIAIAETQTERDAMEGRLGYQPAREELIKRGISVRQASQDLNIPGRHLDYAIRGRAHPMDIVRQRLPEYLRMPLHKLFTQEALSKRYNTQHNQWRKRTSE